MTMKHSHSHRHSPIAIIPIAIAIVPIAIDIVPVEPKAQVM